MTTREQHIEDAARILSQWFIHAGIRGADDTFEMRAELRTAVEHIVDAATPMPPLQPALMKLQPGEQDARD
jgi:hypothetical protein